MLPERTAKLACAGGAGAGASDRLSALTDGLLHAILSFLPAPQAVRTAALSRRWRDLWCSMPSINIDDGEFGSSGGVEKWLKFENFTTNLLLLHRNAVSLYKFRLSAHCVEQHHQRDVERWIRCGVKYCPRVLVVWIMSFDRASIMLSHLGSGFRRLERLELYNVILDCRFAELLCSSSSVLEELELLSCVNLFQDITSSTLKKLVIGRCEHESGNPLVITAPALEFFFLHIESRCYEGGISLRKTAFLFKADILIEDREYLSNKRQRELLSSLSNVTNLVLWGFETTVRLPDMLDASERYSSKRN